MFQVFRLPCVFLAATALCQFLGCASFTGQNGLKSSPDELPAVANGPRVTVELRSANDKSEMQELPMSDPMHVQQAVEQSGAAKKFRRMKIELLRPIAGERQKLASKYAHEKGMVDPGYDYALYPGDHIVIVEDPSTFIDDMVGSLGLPMNALGQR